MSRTRGGDQSAIDLLKLRKQYIQANSQIQDLQEELEDKTSQYLSAIKMRDKYKEKVDNTKKYIDRVDEIVREKVQDAIGQEKKELENLKQDHEKVQRETKILQSDNEELRKERDNYRDRCNQYSEELGNYARNSSDMKLHERMDILQREKTELQKRLTDQLHQLNSLSNSVDDIQAENRQLRKMAGVPDNYGIDLNKIKLHNKEKIEDYRRLIKVLQDDNYTLEKERAKLKHDLKQQCMIYNRDYQMEEKYKELTPDQLLQVENLVLRMGAGEDVAIDNSDAYRLQVLNKELEAQNRVLENQMSEAYMNKAVARLGRDNQLGAGFSIAPTNESSGINKEQYEALLQQNNDIKTLVNKMAHGGSQNQGFYQDLKTMDDSRGSYGHAQQRLPMTSSSYLHPQPRMDGSVADQGLSQMFGNSKLQVGTTDGKRGITDSSVYETAFLQCQVQEVIMQMKRKDEELKVKNTLVDDLNKRVRQYLLAQDSLYKDLVRCETAYDKKAKNLVEQKRDLEDRNHQLSARIKDLMDGLDAVQKNSQGGGDKVRIIELTKQNSILDVNLLRLTRKYQALEDQEKLLRREFHSKDEDAAEKDRYVAQRINSLKMWKSNAIFQMDSLFKKLKNSVHQADHKEVEQMSALNLQRYNDLFTKNAKTVKKLNDLQKYERLYLEADEKYRVLQETKDQVEEEMEIIKRRLEHFDETYKWENQVFKKIAQVLQRAHISPQDAFEEFDESRDGKLDKNEFQKALQLLKIDDINEGLSQMEVNVLWQSLDTDNSGDIDYTEFIRKLERYGVKNYSKEEQIIYQLIEAARRAKIENMSALFELMDVHNRGYISRTDFEDLFKSLNLTGKVNKDTLHKFINNFWKDETAGIDYKNFLRIFSRFQVRLSEEECASKHNDFITPERLIVQKKDLYMKFKRAMEEENITFRQVFSKIDTSGDQSMDLNEFKRMFTKIDNDITDHDAALWFNTIDFDGNGEVSLPEFITDFNHYVDRTVEQLILEQQHKQRAADVEQQRQELTRNYQQKDMKELGLRTQIDIHKTREEQLKRKNYLTMQQLKNSEKTAQLLLQEHTAQTKEIEDIKLKNYTQRDQLMKLQKEASTCIKKDQSDNIVQRNDLLATELQETRAAMLSYKNMCSVISDQVTNLKLMHERRKDEQDNLFTALRETQADGVGKDRLAKLYFIIMLSRWQEASVNKKYEQALTEVRQLHKQVQSSDNIIAMKEKECDDTKLELSATRQDRDRTAAELEKREGVYIRQDKVHELDTIIQDLGDAKSELEEEYMKKKSEWRKGTEELGQYKAKSARLEQLNDDLKLNRTDEVRRKLIDMSDKMATCKLNEYRATSDATEMRETEKHLRRLLTTKTEEVMKLQQEAAELHSAIDKKEEEFRHDKNRITEKYLTNRMMEEYKGPNNNFQRLHSQQNQRGAALAEAGLLSKTKKMYGVINEHDVMRQAPVEDVAFGKQEKWVDVSLEKERDVTRKQMSQLTEEVAKLVQQLSGKDATIQRYEQWTANDQYLSSDEKLKDEVEKHKVVTMQANQNEAMKMQTAMNQTVKTLKEMIASKDHTIDLKDSHIKKLKENMKVQKDKDLDDIASLQRKLNEMTDNAVGKMHDIVRRDNHQQRANQAYDRPGTSSDKPTGKWANASFEQMDQAITGKDREIRTLKTREAQFQTEKEYFSKKTLELNNKCDRLNEELQNASKRTELDIANRKISSLKKEMLESSKNQVTLQKSLKKLAEQLRVLEMNNESGKAKGKDDIEILDRRGRMEIDGLARTVKNLETQKKLAEGDRDAAKEQIIKLKVLQDKDKTSIDKMRSEMQAADKRATQFEQRARKVQQDLDESLVSLEHYKRENKDKSNMAGGRASTYEQLQLRNKELEDDNMILKSKQKTVVAHNADLGTFEYIGSPQRLDETKNLTTVQEILEAIIKWLSINKRLTVAAIFRSHDRSLTKQIHVDDFKQAFERIGIAFQPTELKLLEKHLDPKNTQSHYLEYDQLVMHITGRPQQSFIPQPLNKLADLCDDKGWLARQFKEAVSKRGSTQLAKLTPDDMARQLKELSPTTCTFSAEESQMIFSYLTKSERIPVGASVMVTELADAVFEALKALVVARMQDSLTRTNTPLIDMMKRRNKKGDDVLTEQELRKLFYEDLKIKPFSDEVFRSFVLDVMLDPQKTKRVGFAQLKHFFGEGQHASPPIGAKMERPQKRGADQKRTHSEHVSEEQLAECRVTARKILIAYAATLQTMLAQLDNSNEGLIDTTSLHEAVVNRSITGVEPSNVDQLLAYADSRSSGFVVISNFIEKLQTLGAETEEEQRMRQFGRTVGSQGLNLRHELARFDQNKQGKLNLAQFKRAMKNLALAMNDGEIEGLFRVSGPALSPDGMQLDIKKFVTIVSQAAKEKALPSFVTASEKPGLKVSRGGGMGGASSSAYDHWEMEKKYKRNLEALKTEIEERNKEIQIARNKCDDAEKRVRRLQVEKDKLEEQFVNTRAKTAKEMKKESVSLGELNAQQQLKEEIFFLQEKNKTLQKVIQVDFKKDMALLAREKDQVEEKMRRTQEQLADRDHEYQQLLGRPEKMDDIARREEVLHQRQNKIEEQAREMQRLDEQNQELEEQLTELQEKNLNLRFEKEGFDLQYARLQKRIQDLEQFKMQSNALSAELAHQREAELAEIAENTGKLNMDSLTKKPGETVKLRRKTSKTAQELEMVVESLKRVIEKQMVEMEGHKRQITRLETVASKKSNEPALLNKISGLEKELNFHLNKETIDENKDLMIRKLTQQNKLLREDFEREIKRFALLEEKYTKLLVDHRTTMKSTEKDRTMIFSNQTGANIGNFGNFLDEDDYK